MQTHEGKEYNETQFETQLESSEVAMKTSECLLILGASSRAAAFSALRAGLCPECIDLFADIDLSALCKVTRIPSQSYPEGLLDLAHDAPPGPWLYTGALENRPALIKLISGIRNLWGNSDRRLNLVRDPVQLRECLAAGGFPFPRIETSEQSLPTDGSWVLKPYQSSGGTGIERWVGQVRGERKDRSYYQQVVEGTPCAAIYVGNGEKSILLGVTEQLVGLDFLHAGPFSYCGSIGPMKLEGETLARFELLGECLVAKFRLRGLFGVDAILSGSQPWLMEVNPRYTASVEVLEYASGMKAMALHRAACLRNALDYKGEPYADSSVIGKAILFAGRKVVQVPPSVEGLLSHGSPDELPDYADIPQPGTSIKEGWPIISAFAEESNREKCLAALKAKCHEVEAMLAC